MSATSRCRNRSLSKLALGSLSQHARFSQEMRDDTQYGNGIRVAQLTFPMESDIDPVRVLTLQQAADVLQISLRTASRMAQSKQLPAFKVGGQWRVRESELAKWLDEGLNER